MGGEYRHDGDDGSGAEAGGDQIPGADRDDRVSGVVVSGGSAVRSRGVDAGKGSRVYRRGSEWIVLYMISSRREERELLPLWHAMVA